ncbi:MAG: 4-hydroxy-tetrahydrodipicolinate reductase [Clostridia bacterium]|nr:4-hydroxy-tetrahydrodipicolinate reductase [Clostridia bacterium]
MTKIFLFGISGKMGNFIVDCCRNTDCEVVGGYDIVTHPTIPTFTSVSDISVDFDVIVDFSRACLLSEVVKLAKATKKGVVLATTGYSEEDEKVISDLSTLVPVLRSGNMSVGVNLLLSLVETATKALADKFDIEIIEKHHNQKADAPSGTALMLANEVKKIKTDAKYLYGRQGESKREKEDVTIHAVRGGTIVGEHDVIFAGNDEIITLSHTALSRKIFAEGAIKAARFIATATPGLYTMKNAL